MHLKTLRGLGCRRVIAAATAASLAGCSLLDPYVKPDDTLLKAYQESHSLESATDYAEALQEEYLGAISDQAMLKSGVGLALIPISAAALYFGIQGIHPDTVLALGLGGAGTYLGAQYLSSQPRELIYVAGSNAVSCAVIAMAPVRAARDRLVDLESEVYQLDAADAEQAKIPAPPKPVAAKPSLTRPLARLGKAINKLDGLVAGVKDTAASARTDYDLALIADAKAVLLEGRKANAVITTSGDTLYGAIQQIRGTVTQAIIETEPNLTALVSSLSSALPLRANQIAPAVKKPEKSKGALHDVDPSSTLNNPDQDRINAENALIDITEQVRGVVDLAKAAPSKDYLAACGVNIKEAGLNFAIDPATPITFSNPDAIETHTISISGGQSPYSANWSGSTPADLSLTLTYEADGKGVLTLKETTAKPAKQSYVLSIHDAGSNAVPLDVTTGAAAGGSNEAEDQANYHRGLHDALEARKCVGKLDEGADLTKIAEDNLAGINKLNETHAAAGTDYASMLETLKANPGYKCP